VQIPTGSGTPDLGQDPAFSARETPTAPSFEQPAPTAQPFAQPQHQPEMAAAPREVPAAPANFAAGSQVAPSEAALAATVRLRVEDAGGHSFGTGTIIDCVKDEALVITCGHIFRESKGQGKIIVDLHAPGSKEPVMGQLISFDLTRDIALVSIRPGVAIKPVVVASDPRRAVESSRVFSIGCDHGRDPSVRESRINAVNKYIGAPNYSVAGAPVQGRSGGGLFLADGSLIGICNAADEQGDEGFYVGLPTVHWQLDKIGQTAIYKRGADEAVALAATSGNDAPFANMNNVASSHNPASEQAMVAVPAFPGRTTADDREVICIVRSKNQRNAPSEVIVVEQPTVELFDLLARSKQPLGALSNNAQPQSQPTSFRTQQPEEQQPVVRGQSR
ncbi:MAG TPA: trypsin-like peptidase domain-containing protein, partial [Pirellulaceae bacterium]|nr:trypsin-like peptidase domain-containing protein [Pirellulaceae bacterium]